MAELFSRGGFVAANLTFPNQEVEWFYNKRVIADQWIKEGKRGERITRRSCRPFFGWKLAPIINQTITTFRRPFVKHLFAMLAGLVLIVGVAPRARAQAEVTLIAPIDLRAPITQIIPGFERKTGIKVKATFGYGVGTREQIARGAPFDVPILQPPYPNVLASGNVIKSTARLLVSVPVGVAVRQGAPKPDISSPEAVRRMLLAAKSIATPNPTLGATAAVNFERMLRRMGIYKQVQPKVKFAPDGAAAMALVANGRADIGLTFLSEMGEPGIDIVGPLAASMLPPTKLVGFISAHAKNPAAAKELLEYLSSPAAAKIYKAHGMEPGR